MSGLGVDEKAVRVRAEVGMVLHAAVGKPVADRLQTPHSDETPGSLLAIMTDLLFRDSVDLPRRVEI